MQRRVGIVIPTYNAGDLLLESVDSVLGQTEDVDLVVVDDCSTDPRSLSVLDQLSADGLLLIRHTVNTGPGGAMNSGIAVLGNPYVAAVGADDAAHPRYAQDAADVLDSDEGIRIVTTALQKFGTSTDLYVPDGAPRGVIDLLFYNTVPGISMLRRQDWDTVGGYGSLTWGEDYDFWVRVLHATGGKCVVLPETRYHYRMHRGQVTEQLGTGNKLSEQVEMVRRNPGPWQDHIDVVMERLWRNQAELDYYRKRYGKINYIKNVFLARARGARGRLRTTFGR